MTNPAPLKFLWNGIKAGSGKLQSASYSKGSYTPESKIPEGTITVYARGHSRFSSEVRAAFDVKNDTDTMTDYFEGDTLRVRPDHALYAVVSAAEAKQAAHRAATAAKRTAKRNARIEAIRAGRTA